MEIWREGKKNRIAFQGAVFVPCNQTKRGSIQISNVTSFSLFYTYFLVFPQFILLQQFITLTIKAMNGKAKVNECCRNLIITRC